MIEIVAFDFDKELRIYRDGQIVERTNYYYDDINETYSYTSLLSMIRALAPEAPIYHLTDAVFIPAVEARSNRHNAAFVLELARKHGGADMSARAPWRRVVTETWIAIGQQVRDEFGVWWIRSLPEKGASYGYAQIEVASTSNGEPERHIYLNEFLRDFKPVI